MSKVRWTKFYDLYVQDEHFRIFISVDNTGSYHAGCLWYEGERVLKVVGQPGGLRLALETRVDTTEQAALDELLGWVKSQFGEDFKLVPSK